jgi:hypothetical protein
MGIGELAIGGIPVAVFVTVVVQALKWGGLLKTSDASRIAVVVASVVGAGVWAAMTLVPSITPYVQVFFTAIIGAALATLGYTGVDKFMSRRQGGG